MTIDPDVLIVRTLINGFLNRAAALQPQQSLEAQKFALQSPPLDNSFAELQQILKALSVNQGTLRELATTLVATTKETISKELLKLLGEILINLESFKSSGELSDKLALGADPKVIERIKQLKDLAIFTPKEFVNIEKEILKLLKIEFVDSQPESVQQDKSSNPVLPNTKRLLRLMAEVLPKFTNDEEGLKNLFNAIKQHLQLSEASTKSLQNTLLKLDTEVTGVLTPQIGIGGATQRVVFEGREAITRDADVKLLLTLLGKGKLNLNVPGKSLEAEFTKFVGQLTQEVEEEGGGTQKFDRETVRRALTKLQRTFAAEKLAGDGTPSKVNEQMKSLSKIEQAIVAQEALENLAPVMQILKEPVALIFPLIISGFATNLHVVWRPFEEQVEEEKEDESKGKRGGYNRLEIYISLPHLGGIKADLAFREDDLILTLITENPAIADFINKRMPHLEAGLHPLGFLNNKLNALSGEVTCPTPEWVRELGATKKRVL